MPSHTNNRFLLDRRNTNLEDSEWEELSCPCNSNPGIAILLHEIFGTCLDEVFRGSLCFFFLYSGIAVQAKCISRLHVHN